MGAVGCCRRWRLLHAAVAAADVVVVVVVVVVAAAYSHGVVDQQIEVAFVAPGSVRHTYTAHPYWTLLMTIHGRSSHRSHRVRMTKDFDCIVVLAVSKLAGAGADVAADAVEPWLHSVERT